MTDDPKLFETLAREASSSEFIAAIYKALIEHEVISAEHLRAAVIAVVAERKIREQKERP